MSTQLFRSLALLSTLGGLFVAGPTYQPNAQGQTELFLALQTHMPTRHGDVPHWNQQEAPVVPQTTGKIDPAELQREASELLELSQSLQPDVQSLAQGIRPKDTVDKLKRIQKVAKHMRSEIEP
jgi:hypothetical protein